MVFSNVVFAGAAEDFLHRHQSIGVVLIGPPDFKSQEFYDCIADGLMSETDNRYSLVLGNDTQNKYMEYWFNQGFLEDQIPKKDDLLNFVGFSGYDKILFLMIDDPVTEKHSRSGGSLFFPITITQVRTSITINSFLCSKDTIIKTFSVTKQDDSEWSDMRAKKGAMEKCAKDIGNEMRTYFVKPV